MKMEIDKLSAEELKFIIDNFDKIKNEYQEKINLKIGDVFFKNIELNDNDKIDTRYKISIIDNIYGDEIYFTVISLSEQNGISIYKMSLEEELFKDEYKQHVEKNIADDLFQQFKELNKEYEKVSKRFFEKSKNILENYKVICKKCGRGFDSVKCFDIDCPYKEKG